MFWYEFFWRGKEKIIKLRFWHLTGNKGLTKWTDLSVVIVWGELTLDLVTQVGWVESA